MITQPSAGNSLGASLPFLGQLATRCGLALANNTTNKQIQTRTTHYARSVINSLQIVIPNYYYPSGIETATGAVASVTASIEYPAGVIHRILFSGATTGSIPSGAHLISDAVAVSIPYGAQFFVRIWFSNSAMILFQSPATGINLATDGIKFGVTTPDLTGGGVVGVDFNAQFFPAAIIGYTTRPSVCLVGDSRVEGFYDTVDTYGDLGQFARSVGPSLPYINLGVGGDTAFSASSTFTNRLALSQYCSHVLINYGVNDIATGRTAIQLAANINTLIGLFPATKPVWVATVPPEASSTDAFVTTTNQTSINNNAVRVTHNTNIRAGGTIIGSRGFIDLASIVESSLNSGLWAAPGFTADGVHETQLACVKIQASNIIPVANFVR